MIAAQFSVCPWQLELAVWAWQSHQTAFRTANVAVYGVAALR